MIKIDERERERKTKEESLITVGNCVQMEFKKRKKTKKGIRAKENQIATSNYNAIYI